MDSSSSSPAVDNIHLEAYPTPPLSPPPQTQPQQQPQPQPPLPSPAAHPLPRPPPRPRTHRLLLYTCLSYLLYIISLRLTVHFISFPQNTDVIGSLDYAIFPLACIVYLIAIFTKSGSSAGGWNWILFGLFYFVVLFMSVMKTTMLIMDVIDSKGVDKGGLEGTGWDSAGGGGGGGGGGGRARNGELIGEVGGGEH